MARLALCCLLLCHQQFSVTGQPVEVEFEPVGPGGPWASDAPPPELLDVLRRLGANPGDGGGQGAPPPPPLRRSGNGREADLDQAIEGMLGELLRGPPGPLLRGGAPPLMMQGGPPFGGGVVLDGPLGGPPGGLPPALMGPGAPEVLALGPGGPVLGASGDAGQPARIPADAFRELFPGPLVEVSEVESPDGTVVEFDSPFGGAPDPHVLDMLQGLGREFQSEMLPAIRKQASAGAWQAPLSCRDDLQKLCPGDKHRLACLGRHQDAVSEACRRDVGKSVPFLCSGEIEKFCTPASEGILPCLARSAGEASPACREAVAATRGLVGRARTQKAVVTNPATGEKKVHVPTAEPAAQRERRLDSQIAGRQAPSSTKAPQSAGVAAPSPELAALREANLDALLAGEPASPRPAQSGDEASAAAARAREAASPTRPVASTHAVFLRAVGMLGAAAGFLVMILRSVDLGGARDFIGQRFGCFGEAREPLKGGLPRSVRPPTSM